LNVGDGYISPSDMEKIKTHFRIQNEKQWTNERTSGITVYNLVNIEVNYPEAKEEVNLFILKIVFNC